MVFFSWKPSDLRNCFSEVFKVSSVLTTQRTCKCMVIFSTTFKNYFTLFLLFRFSFHTKKPTGIKIETILEISRFCYHNTEPAIYSVVIFTVASVVTSCSIMNCARILIHCLVIKKVFDILLKI